MPHDVTGTSVMGEAGLLLWTKAWGTDPWTHRRGSQEGTCVGPGSWDYSWVFFFGFPRILFYILNTNGKEDLNQLECWAETNPMKWNREK